MAGVDGALILLLEFVWLYWGDDTDDRRDVEEKEWMTLEYEYGFDKMLVVYISFWLNIEIQWLLQPTAELNPMVSCYSMSCRSTIIGN